MPRKDLTGTVSVLTGAAGGIGFEMARQFASMGSDIILSDMQASALEKAAESLRKEYNNVRVESVVVDVTKQADNAKLLDAAKKFGKPIGVLALNAGISAGGRLEFVPMEEGWKRLFEVNIFGVVRGFNLFLPVLVSQGRASHVILTGSSNSFATNEDGMDGPYVATKHALLGVAKSYRNYLKTKGVSVQLLAPKLTDTAFPRSSVGWGAKGPKVSKDRHVPKELADTPEQVARMMANNLGGPLVISAEPDLRDRLIQFAKEDVLGTDPKL